LLFFITNYAHSQITINTRVVHDTVTVYDTVGINVDLSELDLTKLEVNLDNRNFSYALFTDNAVLSTGVDPTTYSASIFIGCDMTNANMTSGIFENCNFTNATLITATLDDANLKNTNFTGANLNNASLDGADLEDADFTNATLTNANLTDTDLSNTTFSNTSFAGANLTGADLSGATVDFDKTYIWTNCTYNAVTTIWTDGNPIGSP
jgi:uncharacterized protein YjbI with pentapeptide repeats